LRRVSAVPPDPCPLAEDALLRENLYPYRAHAPGPADPMFDYEKILVERVVLSDPGLPGTVLRLPMVYGPGDPQHRLFPYLKRMDDRRPAILLTEGQAGWRWTRGYVENIAAAVAHAAAADRAAGCITSVRRTPRQRRSGLSGSAVRAVGLGRSYRCRLPSCRRGWLRTSTGVMVWRRTRADSGSISGLP